MSDRDCKCKICSASTEPLGFLLWKERSGDRPIRFWYRTQSAGYTRWATVAGRYSRECALGVQRATHGDVWAVKEGSRGFKRLLARGDNEDGKEYVHTDRIQELEAEVAELRAADFGRLLGRVDQIEAEHEAMRVAYEANFDLIGGALVEHKILALRPKRKGGGS